MGSRNIIRDEGGNPDLIYRSVRDWHKVGKRGEPPCGKRQWRTADRRVVVNMSDMTIGHLRNCILFASTKTQHSSRLAELLIESRRRYSYGSL